MQSGESAFVEGDGSKVSSEGGHGTQPSPYNM